jgi:hypothetical protein
MVGIFTTDEIVLLEKLPIFIFLFLDSASSANLFGKRERAGTGGHTPCLGRGRLPPALPFLRGCQNRSLDLALETGNDAKSDMHPSP